MAGAAGKAKALAKVPAKAPAYGLRGTTATPKAKGLAKRTAKRPVR